MTAPHVNGSSVNGHGNEAAAIEALRPQVGASLANAAAEQDLDAAARAAALDALIGTALDGHARQALREGHTPLTAEAEERVARALRHAFLGLGGLQDLLDDPSIETININGCDNVWAHYRDGTRAQVPPVATSDEELIALLRAIGARGAHERRFDKSSPELSMQLPGGARLFAVQDVTDRVSVSIRLHPQTQVTIEDLWRRGEMTAGLRDLLAGLVRARRNIVVSGGPAVGKTTLLRALASAIPSWERLITIEDAYELALSKTDHPNMVVMQSREANIEGAGEYDIARGVRGSLRLTPDRVIVGEVRGAEVVQMAKAMSIGIDGSMATVHASSSGQAFLRLITYAMEPPALYPREAATASIAGAVHVVIHLDLAAGDGTRVISSVREVTGSDGDQILSNEIYRPGPDRRAQPATMWRTETLDLLASVGVDAAALLQTDRW